MIKEIAELFSNNSWLQIAVSALTLIASAISTFDLVHRVVNFSSNLLNKFSGEVPRRATLCRTMTGYVGALLARYTAIVTMNLLIFNVALNLAAISRTSGTVLNSIPALEEGFYVIAGISAISVLVIIWVILAICNEVLRQSEGAE